METNAHEAFSLANGRQGRTLPRKQLRRKPYTTAELSDHVDDLLDAQENMAEFLAGIRSVSDKTWKLLRFMTPLLIGALLASGVISGPMGEGLRYIADHWPQ